MWDSEEGNPKDSNMPITLYQRIKRPSQMALWDQLDQQGNTSRHLTSQSNEEPIAPCDISHHRLEVVTPFTVPEGQREVCQIKSLFMQQQKAQRLKAGRHSEPMMHYIQKIGTHTIHTVNEWINSRINPKQIPRGFVSSNHETSSLSSHCWSFPNVLVSISFNTSDLMLSSLTSVSPGCRNSWSMRIVGWVVIVLHS